MNVAAQTAENIRDTFGALHKTSFDLQACNEGGKESENDAQIRFFYQTTKEVFSQWAHQMQEVSQHMSERQAKFF
jgi:hypothetical protein